MNLEHMVGADKAFQHVADSAKGYVDILDGKMQPPMELRNIPVATGRDFQQFHLNTKGRATPILAGECVLMGVITGCTHLRQTIFRGSEDGDTAVCLNVKTGEPALDADGNMIALDDCILAADEVAAAFPESDVYMARIDCPKLDQDGALTGVPLIMGAVGEATGDCFETRAMGQLPGSACYAVILIPTADVPDLASVWIDVEIANGFAR